MITVAGFSQIVIYTLNKRGAQKFQKQNGETYIFCLSSLSDELLLELLLAPQKTRLIISARNQ